MPKLFSQPIPLWFFGIVLVMWIISTGVTYIAQERHTAEMQAFISKGKRFTQQDGEAMARRIEALEAAMETSKP